MQFGDWSSACALPICRNHTVPMGFASPRHETNKVRRLWDKTDNSPTTCRRATSLGSAGSGVMEWDRTQSDDGAGVGGVALDWVFTVEGGARVCVCRDSQGVMRGGWNELGWVGIGESLTSPSLIQTLLKPQWRSSPVNHWALCSQDRISEMRGSG